MPHRIFTPRIKGVFLDRPNRFIVHVQSNKEVLRVHCANPGRMRELLLPGCEVILEESTSPNRKTRWTLAAAIRNGNVIPLISARSNSLAGNLLLPHIHPSHERAAEQKLGDSRIDWKLSAPSGVIWTEVKACTLVERKRAMFPDAPSLRAVKHLKELKSLSRPDRGEVLFTVMNPEAVVFSPNPHTDPVFTMALATALKEGLQARAVSISTSEDGLCEIENWNLDIDLSSSSLVEGDSGVIILIEQTLEDAGKWRIYGIGVESTFNKTIKYHLSPARRRKRGPESLIYPIRGKPADMANLMVEIEVILEIGNSDYPNLESNPFLNPTFVDLLLEYRHEKVFCS